MMAPHDAASAMPSINLHIDIFHDWIQQALLLGLTQSRANCALLIDLHGHGHPHEYIELGYRLSAAVLNTIAEEQDSVRSGREITLTNDSH